MQSFWQMIVMILITHIYGQGVIEHIHVAMNALCTRTPIWLMTNNQHLAPEVWEEICVREAVGVPPAGKNMCDLVPLETLNLELNFPNIYISKKIFNLQKSISKRNFSYSCRVLLSSIVKPEKAEQSFRNIYTNDLIDYFDFIFTLINW